jgi:hypothetical protein
MTIAKGVDGADQLMTGDEREDGVEVAVVDVAVGAAEADLDDFDEDLARAGLRGGKVLDLVVLRSS